MGEMVDNQTAKQTAKPLRKGKKKHKFQKNRNTLLVILVFFI
jgi:hypothetical protein